MSTPAPQVADEWVRETVSETTFKLRGAPSLPDCAAGQGITPTQVRKVVFSGTRERPEAARIYVEAKGPSLRGGMNYRTQKWNIMGTSSPDISLAPQWIRLLVGA